MDIIKPIATDTVHKICSGQVVVSLAVAVKELVENSLDAGATTIDIRFKNYGIDLIEVSDNGTGVTEDNFAALTLKYHTSKLSEYSDLLGVTSFGFRGEALSSLCSLANLTITTRHKDCEYATKLEYDHKGNITKQSPCSRQVGTTVTLTNLFSSLPVRQKEFHKNAKREFNKMTQLLYAYCLISVGVKITCYNQTSSNPKSLVVGTQGQGSSYKDNIASVFGVKQLQTLLEIKPEYGTNIKDNIFKGLSGEVQENNETAEIEDIEIDLSEDSNDADKADATNNDINISQKSQGHKNIVKPIEFTGFISSCAHGSGRSSTDRQFYYVNSRPCEPTKIIKVINEIYRQYNSNQYPFVFLNVEMERTTVDVNVTPDKRKIFLTKEKIIMDILKNSLVKLFETIPSTLKIESTPNFCIKESKDVKPELKQPRVFNSFLQQFQNKTKLANSVSTDDKESTKVELKRKSTTMLDFISSKTKKTDFIKEEEDFEDTVDQEEEVEDKNNESADILESEDEELESCDSVKQNIDNKREINENKVIDDDNKSSAEDDNKLSAEDDNKLSAEDDKKKIMYLDFTEDLPTTQIRDLSNVVIEKSHTTNCNTKAVKTKANTSSCEVKERTPKKQKIVTDKEDLGKNNRKSVTLKTSLEHVKALTSMYVNNKRESAPTRVKFKSEINPVFNKKCEEELSKEISKDSFKKMHVIGQFNLGFIITQLEDDLFIIDQHATDEIYNFETLQKTTELTSQKLVIPQQLELAGVNEQILIDNLDVFKKNGFTFEINEEALPTKRVKLLTLPMSKNWIFGKEDIEELLFMLKESPSEYCRPSRVRAMFASRACRKSVMIGTALSKADMKKLVDHMAEIDKPWNCPHGRPTIRHLVNLAMVHTKDRLDT
nr:mismatch repair endonuclease PMS2 [Helicoverpa armigera]